MSEKKEEKIAIFWFRRDLRLDDNVGMYHALKNHPAILPLFIFDTDILDHLPERRDRRVEFIVKQLQKIHHQLKEFNSSILIRIGKPLEIWSKLLQEWVINAVYTNHDYEPYAIERDKKIAQLLSSKNIPFYHYKDQVIFEKDQISKSDGTPYSVYTPYKKRWMDALATMPIEFFSTEQFAQNFFKMKSESPPELKQIGFQETKFNFPSSEVRDTIIKEYDKKRDFPAIDGTSRLGIHLRFGTISIRKLVKRAKKFNLIFLSELIWREFFMMILYYYPKVVDQPFKKKYAGIKWINNPNHFQRWCEGKTGYPMVDAGMRELNESGYMHNRVRMITSSFLAKHLLIDWRWGEKYFADKLLDFELSSNNGNWQWAAGCGCDAAPYFRIFNPTNQVKKFDSEEKYIQKWVPEFRDKKYPPPMVAHKFARERALSVYKAALK